LANWRKQPAQRLDHVQWHTDDVEAPGQARERVVADFVAGCGPRTNGALHAGRKLLDLVAARTGVRDHEATAAGFAPLTVASEADDHKAYYPGSRRIHMRYTGDRRTGRLLGLQLVGRRGSEIAKRIDIAAAAIHNGMTVDAISDLDLSYTRPLGSPWDALQHGAQAWSRAHG
jgi:NADPH-dependent 2,4-dienoyl-CoA reductase/sulfur reductase-like enzyme